MRTFIDNIIVLALEGCLLHELPKVFTTIGVQDMKSESPSLLRSLASEHKEIRRRREILQETIDDLNRALKKCEDKLEGFDLDDYEIPDFEFENHQPTIQVSSPHHPVDNDIAATERVTTPIHRPHSRSPSSTSAISDITGHTASSSVNLPSNGYESPSSSLITPERVTSPYQQGDKRLARFRRARSTSSTNPNPLSRSGSPNMMARSSEQEEEL
jgi:hypothetical protein